MRELSSGRQALEGAELAPGTLATLAALTDPDRRPPEPREPLPPQLVNHRPQVDVLSSEGLCKNLRTSRRGAAAGPSGMTAEHLRVLLHCPVATVAFIEVATALARADVPDEIMDAGDIVRRLVGHTMAQQFSKRVGVATSPFQYALSTRAGTECVTHVLQTLTDLDERATILSVDGIGAKHGGWCRALALRQFLLWPSFHVSVGDELGDALMPMLFQFGTTSCVGGHCGAVARKREAVCVP